MKVIFILLTLLIFQTTFSQTIINSKSHGDLEFKELDYGLAKVKGGRTEKVSNSNRNSYLAKGF
jgi:hypothetical protein